MRKSAKFIADEMNGDIARWTRIFGYDCTYVKGGKNMDKKILEIAKKEERIVLTSDKILSFNCNKIGLRCIYISGKTREEKIARLISSPFLVATINYEHPRCTKCNSPLKKVQGEKVKDKIPKKVFKKNRVFWLCNSCGKVYWIGGHWKRIKDTVQKAKDMSNKKYLNTK
jgi:uncharacterized protein with PIN domain